MPCFFGGVSTYTAAEDRLPSRSGWSAARPPSGEGTKAFSRLDFFFFGVVTACELEPAPALLPLNSSRLALPSSYTKKETGGLLNGEEARELSSRNYGPDEWWLLLDPAGGSSRHFSEKIRLWCAW